MSVLHEVLSLQLFEVLEALWTRSHPPAGRGSLLWLCSISLSNLKDEVVVFQSRNWSRKAALELRATLSLFSEAAAKTFLKLELYCARYFYLPTNGKPADNTGRMEWDLGEARPMVLNLLDKGLLFSILNPGCTWRGDRSQPSLVSQDTRSCLRTRSLVTVRLWKGNPALFSFCVRLSPTKWKKDWQSSAGSSFGFCRIGGEHGTNWASRFGREYAAGLLLCGWSELTQSNLKDFKGTHSNPKIPPFGF